MIIKETEDYTLDFPIEKRANLINGLLPFDMRNKELINNLLEYYSNENILYFPRNRVLNIDKDLIDNTDIVFTLRNEISLREKIEKGYDVSDPFILKECKIGDSIHCGYLQLLNFYYTIYLHPKNDIILIIDKIEQNLHPLVYVYLMENLIKWEKIKKLIFFTEQEQIGYFYRSLQGIAINISDIFLFKHLI